MQETNLKKYVTLCLIAILAVSSFAFAGGGANKVFSVGTLSTYVVKDDGSLWGWGRTRYLGNGEKEIKAYYQAVKVLDNVKSVSTSTSNTVAVKNDGTLWGWGYLDYKFFEGDAPRKIVVPTKMKLDDVKMAAAGDHFVLALKNDGTLWAGGAVRDGMGEGNEHRVKNKKGFVQIADNVKYVTAPTESSRGIVLYVKNDNTLWGYGQNAYGLFGAQYGDKHINTAVKIMNDVQYVSASNTNLLAIKTDGSLWGCGSSGMPTVNGYSRNVETPTKIADNVIACAANFNGNGLFVKADHTLWQWGKSFEGKRFDSSKVPNQIATGVKDVACTQAHIAVLKDDNTLWTAGRNAGIGYKSEASRSPLTKVFDNVLNQAPFVTASGEVLNNDPVVNNNPPAENPAPNNQTQYSWAGAWRVTARNVMDYVYYINQEGNTITCERVDIEIGGAVQESSDDVVINAVINGNTATGTYNDTHYYMAESDFRWEMSADGQTIKFYLEKDDGSGFAHVADLRRDGAEVAPNANQQGNNNPQNQGQTQYSWAGTWQKDFGGGTTLTYYLEQEGDVVKCKRGVGVANGTTTIINDIFNGLASGNITKGNCVLSGVDGNFRWEINEDSSQLKFFSSDGTAEPTYHFTLTKINDDIQAVPENNNQQAPANNNQQAPANNNQQPPADNNQQPSADNAVEVEADGGSAQQSAQIFNGVAGVTIMFEPTNAIGYRIYRSEVEGELGISVTDFYLTSTNFTDVNVKPNTTYYYTLKEVLTEAKPLEGQAEVLGDTLATWTITTPDFEDTVLENQENVRHFIMLKIDDPMMSVDGQNVEVDPGRGTAPIIVKGRTMVPIRAIVEAMGGTIAWNGDERKVTLSANGNTVDMWIDKNKLVKNGEETTLDVAPTVINGRTFVPLRFGAQNLNCQVDWINSTRSIVIVWYE